MGLFVARWQLPQWASALLQSPRKIPWDPVMIAQSVAQKGFALNASILTHCVIWLYSWASGKDGKQGSDRRERSSGDQRPLGLPTARRFWAV